MKYIQVIDGADNCIYPIYGCEEDDFSLIFSDGRDIEFIEDFVKRVGNKKAHEIGGRLWQNLADKKKIKGLHGTLFFQLGYRKSFYFENEPAVEVPNIGGWGRPDSQGRLWIPTGWGSGLVWGAPHWVVLKPDRRYDNVFPEGGITPK